MFWGIDTLKTILFLYCLVCRRQIREQLRNMSWLVAVVYIVSVDPAASPLDDDTDDDGTNGSLRVTASRITVLVKADTMR